MYIKAPMNNCQSCHYPLAPAESPEELMARVKKKIPDLEGYQIPVAFFKAAGEVIEEELRTYYRGLYEEMEPAKRKAVEPLENYQTFKPDSRIAYSYALQDDDFVFLGWTRNPIAAIERYNQPMPLPRGVLVRISKPFMAGQYAHTRIQRYLKRELGKRYSGFKGWYPIEDLAIIDRIFAQVEAELPGFKG
jgi:hypothetical protein